MPESIEEYMDRVRRGEAGVSGDLDAQARSGDPYAQRAKQYQMRENERQAAANAREAERAQAERQKALEDQEKARQAAMKAQHEKNIRQAESIGAIVEEDIETGRKDVARHDDGHVKFKTGKVKDPYKKDGSWVQDYRNDRGKILSDPIKGETITTQDKANSTGLKVGDKYFERKDDFGKSVFEKVGEDQKVAKLHSIGLETEKAEMVKGRLKIEREAFDEQWKPVSKEYEDAKAARDKFFENPSFRNIDGKWVDSDGREVVTDNQISAFNDWQRKASEVSKQYNDSMEKMGKLSPSNDRLTEAEKGIQGKLNKLAEERAMVELGVDNKVLTDGFARSQMRKRGFGEDLDRLDREQAEKFTAYINPFDGKNFDSPVPFSTPAGETLMIPENAKLLWGDKADTVIRMFRLGADEQQIDALFPDEKPKAGIEEVSAVIGAAASTESGQIGQTQKALAESTSPESPDEWISRINEGLPGADPGSLRAERKDMRTTYLVSLYSNVGGRERQIGSIEQGPDGKPILEASIHRDLEREVIKHPGSLPHYLYPRDIKSNYREKKISSEDWNERLEKANAVIEAGEEFALSSEYTDAKVLEALGGPLGGTIEEHLTYLYKQGAINNQQWEANMETFAPHVRTRIPDITSEEVIESEMKSYFQSIEDPEQKKRYAISQSGDNEKLRKTLQKEALERYSAEFKWHPGYDREELQKAYEKVGYKRGTGEFIEDAAINAAGSSVGVIEGVGMQALSATVGWFMPDDIEEAWEQIAKDAKNKTGDKLRGFDFWQGQLTEEEAREAYREVSDKLNKVVIAVDNNEPLEDRLDELSAWVKEMNTKSRDDSASETDSRFDLKKSPAFLNLVEQYRLTANPEYKEAMRAYIFADDYHRRVMSEAMTISTGRDSAMETGFSRRWTNFVDSYYGALNADYVEVGTEIASYGLMKAGSALSKQAIKGTSKLATKVDDLVRSGGKVGLHAKVANSVHKAGLQARDELVSAMRKVMVEDTLANPAGKVGKTWNKAVKGAPSAVAGGIGEGAEEVVASLGETTTTFDSAFEAFIQGAIGGPAVAPIMAVAQAPVSLAGKAQNSSRERVADRKFADWYNKTFAKEDGFQEITSEDANTMRAFLSAANSDAVIKDYSEAHKKIIEADATLERIKGMENRNDAAWQVSYEKANKTIRENYEKLVESEAALADIATLAVSARMDIAKMPAAERTRYTALAKVAAGNEGLLTKNERASIAGLKTEEDNFDYFTKPIDTLEGKGNQLVTRQQTFITKEGREEIARKAPAIANLALQTEIRTPDESSSDPSTVAETAIVEEPTGGNEVRRALDKAISLLPSSVPVSFVEDAGESGMSATWRGINVSLAQLESQVGQLGSQEAIEERIAAMIDEERVHVAQFEAVREMAARDEAENLEEYFETYYSEVWESFTPEQQQAIRDVYQVEEASNAQLAAEGIRMLIQDRASKKVTELTKSFSQGLSEKAKEALRGILDALKKLTGVDLTPLVKSHIEAIEGILAEDSSVDGDGNQKGNEGKPESVIADDTSKVSGKPERKPSSKKTAKKKRNIVTISDVAESGMYGEILLIADHPLIKSIEAQGGILSKTNYQKQGGKNLDLYDGAGKYPPALNKEIYSKSGLAPDVMVQNLYSGERQDGGNSTFIDSPTPDALWDAIEEAYSSVAENNRISRKKFAEVAREETKKLDFYEEAFNREDGDLAIPAKSLVVGDTLVVDGEELVVEALRKDSDGQIDRVTLQDGSRFDRQFVDGDMTLYVESIDEIYEESDPEGKILPDEAYLEEEAAANTPKKKEATSKGFDGEGGDLLSDQKEDFKLAQDETLDGAKVAKDKEEAEKRAEKAEQDQQKLELDEPTLSEGEQALKDAFEGLGIKLDASPDSPVTPPFYSQLSRVIESKIQGRFASPQQIKAVIDPAKGSGVKEEEIKWSGIVQKVDELATENKGKVPVAELKDWLTSDGAVKLQEVSTDEAGQVLARYGYKTEISMDGEAEIIYADGEIMDFDELPDEVQKAVRGTSQMEPKFGQYTIPGGENYREVVLAMPEQDYSDDNSKAEREHSEFLESMRQKYGADRMWSEMTDAEIEHSEELERRAFRGKGTQERANLEAARRRVNYTSSHFADVPNYVAHMRLNERENGLFIEEIQSDRHQEGRKKGYNDERASDAEVIAYMGLKPDISPERIEIARKAMEQRVNAIPDAPFRKDWPLQMFKRALRDAVDSDKDWIGWTTGDTQAERYDLSKQVDRITVLEHAYAPGTYTVTARRNGDEVINKSANSQSEMADLIGKDLAKKAVADIEAAKQRPVPKYATTLEGLDLKVGGEGMKGFYDQILPRAVQKYVKQWGGKVKLQKIGGEPIMKMVPHEVPGHPGGRLVEDEAKSSTETNIWRLDITPDMKSSIRKDGMVLFASPDRSFTTGIPADKLPAFISAAQKLVSDGVNTPEKLVESLEKIGKGNLRQYTDAVWSALRMVDPTLPQVDDWSTFYTSDEKSEESTNPQPKESEPALSNRDDRDKTIKESRDSGNIHLDEIPADVESMRGKSIYYVHDKKVKGVIRTVDNRGNVYVSWSDDYSSKQEMASLVQEGKKSVMQSTLGPLDLKDYALSSPVDAIPDGGQDTPKESQPGKSPHPIIDILQSEWERQKKVQGENAQARYAIMGVTDRLMGPSNIESRQEALLFLTGTKPPRAKAGITVLEKELANWVEKNPLPESNLDSKPDSSVDQDSKEGNQSIETPAKSGFLYNPRNKRKGAIPESFRYEVSNDVPLKDGETVIASEIYERKIGKNHPLYRISVIESADGDRFSYVERGEDLKGSYSGAITNFIEITDSDTGTFKPVFDQAAKLWKEHPKGQDTFSFEGSETPTDSDKMGIQDFGEKLSVRKNQEVTTKKDLSEDDIASLPLSQIWPKKEVDAIEEIPLAAFATVARNLIPSKPRKGYKLKRWVETVKNARKLMEEVGSIGVDRMIEELRKPISPRELRSFADSVVTLRELPREHWSRVSDINHYPDAYSYDRDTGEKKPSPYAYGKVDGKSVRAGNLEGLIDEIKDALGEEKSSPSMQFEVRGQRGGGGRYWINKKGDPLRRSLKSFDTSKEALAFVRTNHDDLVKEWEKVKESDNVKEADLRSKPNRPRSGQDYRKGKDATTEMFTEAFGFRGVAFGNWVSQGKNAKERQGMLNLGFDSLMDLANIIGVPPKALSLEGTLGLSFGADGKGSASAHYSSGKMLINLTKTRGAGTLAHEWFHALDNYFARKRSNGENVPVRNFEGLDAFHRENFITHSPERMMVNKGDGTRISVSRFKRLQEQNKGRSSYLESSKWHEVDGVRPEVEERFSELVDVLSKSPMAGRARKIDKGKSGGYWSRTLEIAARSFENYVIGRMLRDGYHNDYLANITSFEEFERDKGRYPYHLDDEMETIDKGFSELFDTIEHEETADGNVRLYASPDSDNLIPFPASYRSLGVPREDMPQIKSGDHSAFVQFLEARGVKYSKREVPAKNLKPTQSGYDPAKVEKAKGFDSERSVLVSGDGYILDGHHGWKAAEEEGNKVSILALKAPIKRLLELAKEFPSEQTKTDETDNPENLRESLTGSPLIELEASPITPAQDAEYLAAVEAGDMEKAQEMVDEAAKVAGFNVQATHKTKERFHQFSEKLSGGAGFYFDTSGNNEFPGSIEMRAHLRANSGIDKGSAFSEYSGTGGNPRRQIIEKLQLSGYDHWTTPGGEIAVFDSNQIKSADPVTYDENGEVIPLSERFNENSDSILYSSPDSPSDLNPTQKAMKALLEKSPPLYRDVFLKTLSDSSLLPGEIGKEFGISEKAVQNITRAMKARLNTLIKVADSEKGDTIQPQRDPATGKIEGGRPDLALAGVPEVAAVDQARNEEGLPEVRAHAEAEAEARGMLARDYDGTIEELERVHRGGGTFTDAQTMAAKIIIATESSQATTMDKARLLRFANFIHTYREVGTETARALSARRDPQLNPQERARLYLVESMVTPSGAAAHRLRKADTAEEKTAILEEWIAKMQTVRDGLKTKGFDIDEAIEWSAQSDDILRDSDQRSPLGDYITIAINRADAVTKVVASTIRTGAAKGTPVPELLKQAAQSSGTTMERAAKLYQDFQDYILSVRREAMAKGADLALSASAEEMADLEAIGLIDISDYFERDGKPKKNPPKQSPKRHSNMPPARDRPRAEWDAWVAKEMDRRFKRHQQDPLNIDPPKPLKDFKGARDINDPKQSRKLIEAMGMSAGLTWDKILEWRKMSILTGVKTHTTNILSNTLFSAYELLPKRLVEATYSQTLSMMGFKDKEAGSPTFSEFLVMAFNMRKAIMKGLDLLVRSYQTRSRIFEAEALARPELIDFDGVKADHIPPQLRNKLAKLLRTISFDTLTAFDEMAKGIVGTLESAAYAHRLAKKDGLKGAEYKEFIAKELEYGSQSWNYAVKRAEEMTFQSELGQSEAIVDQTFDTIARAINRGKRGKMKVILDLVFPFVNTPTNIFKKGWNYSPLGTATAIIDASRALRELMKGDNKIASRAAAERLYNRARLMNDLAQQTLAWAGTMAILNMLEADEDDLLEIEGNIPWALRDLGYRRGMGPYTLRIGDLKIAYNRYEPVATAVGFAVDASKVWKKDTDMATKAAGIASVVMNSSREKTYLRGVSDLMDAWDDVEALGDGDEYAQFSATNGLSRLIASQITSLVPNLYRQAARGSDEFIRERAVDRSSPLLIQIGQHINADLNQNAQAPKVDLWGNDIENHSGLFLPGQVTRGLETDEKDEYLHAYNRKFGLTKELKSVLKNSPFTLQQQVNGQRGSLKMTPEMRREYMQIQGKFLREDLKGIKWDTTNPSQEGIEIMVDSRSRAASHAREEILYKYHKEIQWPQ